MTTIKHYKYQVWAERAEAHTPPDKKWTEQELLNAYDEENNYYTQGLKEFENEAEAQAYYKNLEPMLPYKHNTSIGYVVNYEVIGLDKITVGEDGEEEWQHIAMRTREEK